MVIYIFGITEWKSFEIIGEGSCLMGNWMEYTDDWKRTNSKL